MASPSHPWLFLPLGSWLEMGMSVFLHSLNICWEVKWDTVDFPPRLSMAHHCPTNFLQNRFFSKCKTLSLKWDDLGEMLCSHFFFFKLLVEWTLSSPFIHSTLGEMNWLIWLVNFWRITGLAYADFLLSFRNVSFWRGREFSASMPNIVQGPL